MIVLDTHVWIWWINNDPKLRSDLRQTLIAEKDVRISAISFLEIAQATSVKRFALQPSVEEWFVAAQIPDSIYIEPLTTSICVESVRLPGNFHRDPADRIIVALARHLNAMLYTADFKILAYPHVRSTNARA
jgi:PIN domain nuclease of toxin-antitoxin system